MTTHVKTAVGALAGLLATVAQAQVPGVHQHDGFYLRLDGGLGYEEQKASASLGDLKISGGAGEFGIAIGGALMENLILAGHVFALSMSDPSVSMGAPGSSSVSSAGSVGMGPQLTYYFMPANIYVSGTLALTRLTVRSNGNDGNSDYGGGIQLAVGKEWWVGDNWGIGVAGQLFGSSNKDQGSGAPTISTWGAAVAFSATYN